MEDQAAKDRLSKRLPVILILAAGTALFITGRTAKYLFKKVQHPPPSSASVSEQGRVRLRDLTPTGQGRVNFLDNKTMLSSAPLTLPKPSKDDTFWNFVRGDLSQQKVQVVDVGDGFDPVFFTAKAFGIATALVLGTFGLAGYGLARYMQVDDVGPLSLSMLLVGADVKHSGDRLCSN